MPTVADLLVLTLLAIVASCIGGMVGGSLGYAGARAIYDRIVRDVLVEIETTTATITAPVVVDLRINQPTLEPISVPVEAELVGASTNLDLTRRLLEEAPQLGPRALSRILQCSTSTAQTYYVQSLKQVGASVVPDAPLDLVTTGEAS